MRFVNNDANNFLQYNFLVFEVCEGSVPLIKMLHLFPIWTSHNIYVVNRKLVVKNYGNKKSINKIC